MGRWDSHSAKAGTKLRTTPSNSDATPQYLFQKGCTYVLVRHLFFCRAANKSVAAAFPAGAAIAVGWQVVGCSHASGDRHAASMLTCGACAPGAGRHTTKYTPAGLYVHVKSLHVAKWKAGTPCPWSQHPNL